MNIRSYATINVVTIVTGLGTITTISEELSGLEPQQHDMAQ